MIKGNGVIPLSKTPHINYIVVDDVLRGDINQITEHDCVQDDHQKFHVVEVVLNPRKHPHPVICIQQ